MLTGQPFDDLQSIIDQLPDADSCGEKKIRTSLAERGCVTDDGIANTIAWLGTWQGTGIPKVKEAHICVLVSAYEGAGNSSESIDFIAKTAKGAAPVNVLCMGKGTGLRAIELAPQIPHDLKAGWAEQDCMAAVAFGMEATASGGDLLGLSDMAPGNDVSALAVVAACLGLDLLEIADVQQQHDMDGVRALLAEYPAASPLENLRVLGGREIAAAVGAIVAARSRRLPVLVDGWAGLAACAVLEACRSGATDHVLPASGSSAQKAVWRHMGKECLFAFPVAAGAGCGNALAISMMDDICSLLLMRESKSSRQR
ncbi:MAG: nicotinate-nucleotide--dimethylbenzimidazole phosphoribosyltransferase [Alphaproteobacteria bacterium]|nr:nicotinate-nucleotide--dimethylbenzimidazole phosphoribosyltransferase [Alphaproteobacteria bacterium]